jgi:O-antigen ligase
MDLIRLKTINSDELIFLAFLAYFGTMPMGTAPPTIFGAIATGIWLVSGRIMRMFSLPLPRGWLWPVLFMMALPLVGLLYSPDPWSLGLNYAGKIHYWIYGLVLATLVIGRSPERLIHLFLIGLAINAIVGAVQLIGWIPMRDGWCTGLGRGYSTLSAYLVLGIVTVSFYFHRVGDRRWKILILVLTGLYFFQLIILWGRTGYLTFLILSPLLIRNMLPRLSLWKTSMVLPVMVGLMLMSPIVRERIQLSIDQIRFHLNADPSISWGKTYNVHQDRFFMWHSALEIIREHPILGLGTGGYGTIRTSQGDPIAHPHNDLLQMAVSYGLVGVVAYLWLFGGMLRRSWPLRQTPVGFFVLASSLVFLISGLFNSQTLDAGMALLLAVTAGLQSSFASNIPKD